MERTGIILDWNEAKGMLDWIRERYEEYREDGTMGDGECLREAIADGTATALDAALVLWASGCLFDAVTEFIEDVGTAVIG